jgi:hypothetical protein
MTLRLPCEGCHSALATHWVESTARLGVVRHQVCPACAVRARNEGRVWFGHFQGPVEKISKIH